MPNIETNFTLSFYWDLLVFITDLPLDRNALTDIAVVQCISWTRLYYLAYSGGVHRAIQAGVLDVGVVAVHFNFENMN